MGDYNVVAEAGQSLINVICSAIAADPFLVSLINSENLISLGSSAEHVGKADRALLSVYLYRIGEDQYLKNRGPAEGAGGRLRRTPLDELCS
jgi:hypothetical protein